MSVAHFSPRCQLDFSPKYFVLGLNHKAGARESET